MIMKVESIEDLTDGSCRVTFTMDWDTMAIFARFGLENVLRNAVESEIESEGGHFQTFDPNPEDVIVAGDLENEHS
jgi:hypothetical protein